MSVKCNLLITQGSCGTYALRNAVGEHYNKIDGWNTHSRNPEVTPQNSRVVYLFANPYDTILSYFRRDKEEFNSQGGFLFAHVEHIGGDTEYFKKPDNRLLENFVKDDYDPFFLSSHLESWVLNESRNYALKIMKYESLAVNGIVPFMDYWDLPKEVSFNFKQRNSAWQRESPEIQTALRQKYGDLFDIYESIPLVSELKGCKWNS